MTGTFFFFNSTDAMTTMTTNNALLQLGVEKKQKYELISTDPLLYSKHH